MLREIVEKPVRRVVGLMSGTSVDGIDAALTEIGDGGAVRLLAFESLPYPPAVREGIFGLFRRETATVDQVGAMNVLLGELYASAALSVIRKAGLSPEEVDLVGSHGQTIWHQPTPLEVSGFPLRFTVQIGEGAVIAARTGIVTVTDFRVADMALGGQGAPLVPFTEYLLYRRETETVLLQNIGGIGNITVLPAGAPPEAVYAFDTGPGNMLVDGVIHALSGGAQAWDEGGRTAARGTTNAALLALLRAEPYYSLPLPKTTGREMFGEQYTERILRWGREHAVPGEDLVRTVTELTAWSIADAYERYIREMHPAAELIVGGGGSRNETLLAILRDYAAPLGLTVRTQEDLGWSSDAKEAVAFALLADRCVREQANVLPGVTGAEAAAVMGKISLPPRKEGTP